MKQYKKISNPIYQELKNLNLITDKDLVTLSNQTRDAKVKVIKDLKTNIIFLNKHITSNHYYSALKYGDDDRKNIEKLKVGLTNVKTLSGNIKSEIIEDDYRRSEQFKKYLKNKDILDFGCGWGGFLKNLKNYKSLNGVELRNECISHVKHNIKRVKISNNINSFKKSFDIITMFHVLEHLPYQINALKVLKSKLKKNGKIIIEVPHAQDFLILQDKLKEFKKFTFWSEHLILHTYKSLKTVLSKSGFKKINIKFYQRYNFSNHLGWFLNKKPGGHYYYKDLINDQLNQSYCKNLIRIKQTDTLIAMAE